MDEIEEALKPCPFCGAVQIAGPDDEGIEIYRHDGGVWPSFWRIWCEPCGAEMENQSREQLIERWNTRVSDTIPIISMDQLSDGKEKK